MAGMEWFCVRHGHVRAAEDLVCLKQAIADMSEILCLNSKPRAALGCDHRQIPLLYSSTNGFVNGGHYAWPHTTESRLLVAWQGVVVSNTPFPHSKKADLSEPSISSLIHSWMVSISAYQESYLFNAASIPTVDFILIRRIRT